MNYLSNTTNKALMTQARESLKNNWWIAIITYIIFTAILVGIQFIPILGWIVGFLISGAMYIDPWTWIYCLISIFWSECC